MSNRSLVILAASVVILGLFIWFFERHQPNTEEASQLAIKVFGGLTTEEVRDLEIKNRHGAFGFTRSDGGWRLTSPIEGAADEAAVDGVVSSLLNLEIERVFGPGEIKPDAYGLDDPELMVSLTTSTDAHHVLMIGDPTPLGGQRAISREGREIMLTAGTIAAGVDRSLDDWRSRALVDARLADLVSIEITTRGDHIDAVEIGGEWRLRSPIEDLADTELLRNFVADISGVRIEEFLDGDLDIEALGLAQPRHHLVIVPADGAPGTTLDFGATREVDGATQVICRRDGIDSFWVTDRAETVLGKAPVRWREPRVRPFDTWDATTLEIVIDDESLTLNRATGDWIFEDGGEASAASIRDRLSALTGLEAVDFDLMDLGTPEIGRVTVGLGGGHGSGMTFWFHKALGEGGNVLVRVSGRETLMSVRPEDVAPIIGNLSALRPAPSSLETGQGAEVDTDDTVE